MIDRRAMIIGVGIALLASPVGARGAYCSRHPRECRERREREAALAEQEAKRRALLTPEQRAAEDAQREAERRAEKEKWGRVAREQADRDAASEAAFLKAIVGVGTLTAIVAGALAWLARQGAAR